MSNRAGYMQADLKVNDYFIDRYKELYTLPNEIFDSNDAIREHLKPAVDTIIKRYILFDLLNDFSQGSRIFFDESVFGKYDVNSVRKALLSSSVFDSYIIRQLNNCLSYFFFQEFSNKQDFDKEFVDEKTAFFLNFNSNKQPQIFTLIKEDKNPTEAYLFLNDQNAEMTFNSNLLSKLPNGEHNYYFKFQEKVMQYLQRKISVGGANKKIPTPKDNLTHRQEALIYKYKTEAKYIENINRRIDIRNQFGKAREKATDSINELSKAYKKVTAKELETVIPYLAEFPNAQKAAINDIDKIQNGL